jgi:hypothetical protein
VIHEREADALAEPIPQWLWDLCQVWHERRITLITFNYDTLIARAAAAVGLYDWESRQGVTPDDVIDRLPPWSPGPARVGGRAIPDTMRLKKLHGSVAWYAVPGDFTGATLARRSVFGWENHALDPDELRREFPGREPFIVPPASAKSGFYRNPVLRQLWQDAGTALSQANEVHLVGYSLPPADLVTRGMLLDRTSATAQWTVTDIHPERVADELSALGFATNRSFASVEAYASEELSRLAADTKRTIVDLLRDAPPETPIIVSWGENPAFSLEPGPTSSGGFATSGAPVALGHLINSLDHRAHLTAGDLQAILLANAGLTHLAVSVDGATAKVVSATALNEYNSPAPRAAIGLRCALPRPA